MNEQIPHGTVQLELEKHSRHGLQRRRRRPTMQESTVDASSP